MVSSIISLIKAQFNQNQQRMFMSQFIGPCRFFKKIFNKFFKDEALLWAQGLTYTTLFSIIPLLALGFSIFRIFGGLENLDEKLIYYVAEVLTPGAQEKATEIIRVLIPKVQNSPIGIISGPILILLVFALLQQMERAFNRIWNVPKGRSSLRRLIVYWTTSTLGPVLLFVPVIMMITLSKSDIFMRFGSFLPFMLVQLIPFLSIFIFLWCSYLILPNTNSGILPTAVGALIGSALWQLASFGYAVYTTKVLTYSKLYGSLGAIPVFMLWLFLCWIIILFGAEVAYCYQHREIMFKKSGFKNLIENREFHLLRLLSYIALYFTIGRTCTIETLSIELEESNDRILKLINELVKKNIVSHNSENGEILPSRQLNRIVIGDIDPISEDVFVSNTGVVSIDGIILKLWKEREEAVKQEIGDITLQDVIDLYLGARGK